MFRIEVETIGGDIIHLDNVYYLREDADGACEHLWNRFAGDGEAARFSVIDSDGERVTDWEV